MDESLIFNQFTDQELELWYNANLEDSVIKYNNTITLHDIFLKRVEQSKNTEALIEVSNGIEVKYTWGQLYELMIKYKDCILLHNMQLNPGSRIGIGYNNGAHWIACEQAILSCGMVVVPFNMRESASNHEHIIEDSGMDLLFLEDIDMYRSIKDDVLCGIITIIKECCIDEEDKHGVPISLKYIETLPEFGHVIHESKLPKVTPDMLATIVYTSGTTTMAKGVMLSHSNIIHNAYAGMDSISVYDNDVFFSILPLSHMFERTVGFYIPLICGSKIVYYNESLSSLKEGINMYKPTILITVPLLLDRIREKMFNVGVLKKFFLKLCIFSGYSFYEHKKIEFNETLFHKSIVRSVVNKFRMGFGGKLRLIIAGGAALDRDVFKLFNGLGIDTLPGYGMTEYSPIISVNLISNNKLDSMGRPLLGVDCKISDEGELLVKGPSIMLGYWNNEGETNRVITHEGYLMTGDYVDSEDDYLYYLGRKKDLIVLSTGQNVAPLIIENKILNNKEIKQCVVFGNENPHLSALVVVNKGYEKLLIPELLNIVNSKLTNHPSYERIHNVIVVEEEWTPSNGLLTAMLKTKRNEIIMRYGYT